ncbi:SnoaL-like domain-containing protein [Balneolaceae bacterium YR4-1]|uniref:histidine kinase n=1 Tax=Halalkalibaculum roseum TaxID=2709311 RepID=A0A6M1T177_9BACT|nr:ATP-binding protein [Halalkalibaculum roseum]NGP77836.1 SnoaL-like domain-containing protein [Halalkalibaculum roseum]
MKLTKQQEAEIMPIYEEWWHSYLNGDVKTYDHYLDEDYRFVGSTVAEDFLNKVDTTQFFDATADQLSGKTQKRNSKLTAQYYDGIVFITELADAYLLFGDEWTFYGKFRFSSMLRKTSDGWRFIYQHFSVPDSKAHEGETIGFEQVSKENQELRDAIKRRTTELEYKNRELEIETALERVRSASMAMQESGELASVARTVFEQLRILDIDVYRSWIDIFHVEEGYVLTWSTDFEGNFQPNPATFPLDFDETMSDFYRDFKSSSKFIELEVHGDEVKEWFDYLYSASSDPIFKISDVPNDLYQIWAKHQYGTIATTKLSPITEGEKDILNRFAKVFEQSYTRFLDLQKAEEQAREAQIETALEKVRSRTMAMQSSDELTEAASEMFSQIKDLGLNPWSCGFNIFNEDKTVISQWVSSGDGRPIEPFDTPTDKDIFKRITEHSYKDEPLYIEKNAGKELEETYRYMASLPTLDKIFDELESAGITLPKKQVDHIAYFKQGYLMFITYDEVPEYHSIFKRFAKVFEQTYTRFLDLQKSEKRARESEIELALERVRAQVTAMQKSSDLFDIVVNMRKEFISLGHKADYFWHMRWRQESYEMSMTSEDGNRIGMIIRIPKFVHDSIPGLAKWERSSDPVYIMPLSADDAWDYIENMNTHGRYEQADPNAPTEKDIQEIGGLTFIIARTSHGEIGYSLPGEVPDPPQEALDTLKRFAGVFDLAYQRFEDLQAAEQQARLVLEERDRLEVALNELHATQDQLIQQEKLASLGQLTAGIAHEIKNPLNFVNNFSDVSIELIEEAREEVKEKLTTDSQQLTAILDDIESNLRKIYEHGSRADSIVKSMLQHSRGGDGKPEPTPLNPLIKEYVNLAYHGMRAGAEPINVDIKMNLDASIDDVNLIAEDFSRVILNLCNNAFDAMREKEKLTADSRQLSAHPDKKYEPNLTVRTKRDSGTVTFEIEDNGPGIPDELKDKILQPFFTTKKGTQGTGLGLSISNDIVKAHGGTMSINSDPENGTTFCISLPENVKT